MARKVFIIDRFTSTWAVIPGRLSLSEPKPKTKILFEGTAQQCIDWCEAQGAERKGPRLYVREG